MFRRTPRVLRECGHLAAQGQMPLFHDDAIA